MAQRPTIDILLNLVPDASGVVLSHLQTHPELASQQDSHGYSLLHAATSYEQLHLLRALVREYDVDPNTKDEDGETCLFNAESVDVAKEVIELGVDVNTRNREGQTAAEKLDDEDEQPLVAAYLKAASPQSTGAAMSPTAQSAGSNGSLNISSAHSSGESNGIHAPPPMPDGVQVNVGTMHESDVGGDPDPEIRRRIEELAARQDFEGEDGQQELRHLVQDIVSGMGNSGQGSTSRRRLG